MTKVIRNILSNSVRHCAVTGKINICIGESSVEIFNTGESIPQEKLEHIWEAYYKVDESRGREDSMLFETDTNEEAVNENKQGSGLGLAIVKQILDLHGLNYKISNIEDGVAVWFGR